MENEGSVKSTFDFLYADPCPARKVDFKARAWNPYRPFFSTRLSVFSGRTTTDRYAKFAAKLSGTLSASFDLHHSPNI